MYDMYTGQVILNDFREKIEKYNMELVEQLILKDELTNEQESMLIGKDSHREGTITSSSY
jgi:hypothetical protein